jgi:aminoglycoside phosphotransferase (APT) family kinase protein
VVESLASRRGGTLPEVADERKEGGLTSSGMRSPPHGFELTPELHELLRGEPPASALGWCEGVVGRGAEVVGVAPLPGGTASAVHAVDVRNSRGHLRRLVLRRFVRRDWLEEEPDAPEREATALEIIERCPVPTPRLLALDARAENTDVPALLMTRLEGSIEWDPAELEPFLSRLGAVLPDVHATPIPPDTTLPGYEPYQPRPERPPSWSSRPEVWQRAFEIFDGPAPAHERCLIHRDYHPGNVLWSDGAVSGVIDWSCASIGSPNADIGHCRVNLAGHIGIEAAERFLELTGRPDYHAYWDIVAALGGFEEDDLDARDEDFLAYAVDRL